MPAGNKKNGKHRLRKNQNVEQKQNKVKITFN